MRRQQAMQAHGAGFDVAFEALEREAFEGR